MQVELSRHTHHEDICTSSVFSKPSEMMKSYFCIIFYVSLETPQIMTKSLLAKFPVSKYIIEEIASRLALGFEIPKTPHELPRQFASISEQSLM